MFNQRLEHTVKVACSSCQYTLIQDIPSDAEFHSCPKCGSTEANIAVLGAVHVGEKVND